MNEKTVSKNKITKDTLILLMGLFYPALNGYIWRVIVGITGIFGFYFPVEMLDAAVWTLVVIYVILIGRKTTIGINTLIFPVAFALIALLSFLLTDYEYFSVSVLVSLLVTSFSFFVQGALVNLDRVSHKQLYIAAIFTLLVSIAYSVYSIDTKELNLDDNMDFAYKVLPSVLVIFSWLFTEQKKKLAIVLSVIGTFFLVLQGTRGPLLCLAIFVCLMIYKKNGIGKTLLKVGTLVLVVVVILSSSFVRLKLAELTEKIDSTGYSARFITMMIEGELSDGNGRDAIEETLLGDIKEDPFKLRGMFADRQATRGLVDNDYHIVHENGTYAHSLWIEMIYDWGALFGAVILIALLIIILKLVIKSNNKYSYIVMLFVCTGIIHLFLSGSYLQSSNFFFIIGLAMNYKNVTKKERDMLV